MRHPAIYRIDDKVVFTMLTISVVCLLLMAFRYKNRELCTDVRFTYGTNKFDAAFANETVFFSASTQGTNTEKWAWDFGDKTPVDDRSGPFVTHTYKQPGSYTVRLTVNGTCQGAQTINVNSRETAGKRLLMQVRWPSEPLYTGREYYFIDSTVGAQTWSWYFDDEPRRSRQAMAYQFLEPGAHKVVLVVNDDLSNNKIERVFNVLPSQAPKTTGSGRTTFVPLGGGGPPRNINSGTDSKPLTDYLDSANSGRTPRAAMLSDNGLRIAVLNINGGGAYEIRKYLLNNNFANCTIIFNNHAITLDQLKANIKVHGEFGKSITVKQETDANGYIKAIDITADLKNTNKVLVFGGKERKYPY